MTDHNELNTVEQECSYGPFCGFCTLFLHFMAKNNYGGHLWHDFLLNTFTVPQFMACLMGIIIIMTAFVDVALYRTGFHNYHAIP
jgi:hypothetical protein